MTFGNHQLWPGGPGTYRTQHGSIRNNNSLHRLQNITDDIKKFIIEHQTYIPKDIIDILLTVFGYVSKGGAGAILGSIGFCMWFGDKILSFRDYYLPKEYWKYISYHRSWYDGYELRCYVGEDHCIHYIEIPKNPDGSLRWDEAVYI